MQYLGGKSRTAKDIAKILKELRKGRQYVEPFVGAGWVVSEMDGNRSAYDIHPPLIAMYRALQAGWQPPAIVTELDYKKARLGHLSPEEQAFIGFGCSFGGKWFGGYARSGDRNYAKNAKNSLLKKLPKLQGVKFECLPYQDLVPIGCLVYCDPPYEGTTEYSTGKFDYEKFWFTMRLWSKFNTVVISSYQAPIDFEAIASFLTKTDMHTSTGKEARTEKLFMLRGSQ